MLQPQLPQENSIPTETPVTDDTAAPDTSMPVDNSVPTTEDTGIVEGLKTHLDQLPQDQKEFLAEHLTTEFVRAIGIINGPEVAGYLAQFVDPNIVMVPVPRNVAEQHLAQSQAAKQGPAQQQTSGQPMQPPPSAPQAPTGGLMAPKA